MQRFNIWFATINLSTSCKGACEATRSFFPHLLALQRFCWFNNLAFHFNMPSRKFAARSSPFSRFLLGDFLAISVAQFIASSSAKAWKNLPLAPWSQLHAPTDKYQIANISTIFSFPAKRATQPSARSKSIQDSEATCFSKQVMEHLNLKMIVTVDALLQSGQWSIKGFLSHSACWFPKDTTWIFGFANHWSTFILRICKKQAPYRPVWKVLTTVYEGTHAHMSRHTHTYRWTDQLSTPCADSRENNVLSQESHSRLINIFSLLHCPWIHGAV